MDELGFRIFQMASGGFCCSQIMLKLTLEEEENENTDLIRAMSGLCNGVGSSQGICGVLTGGIGVLGLYAGKGLANEYPKEGFGAMVDDFMDWFEDEFGARDCVDLIGVYNFEDENRQEAYPVKCGDILAKSYMKITEILDEYNYELGSREQ